VTKRDYVLLASVLHACKPEGTVIMNNPQWNAWLAIVSAVSRGLASDNRNFNHAVFFRACVGDAS